jgi:hypothetical protein
MSDLECYRILGVKPGAARAELMHAYRVLVKTYHPDSASGNGSASAFVRVVNAYQSLVGQRQPGVRSAAPRPAGSSRAAPRPRPETRNEGTDIFAMGRTLLFGPEPSVRIRAARSLAATGKKSCYAFLRKAFWDKSELVRIAAVRAVGSLGIRQSGGELASLFSKGSAVVRVEVLAAVMKIGARDGFRSVVMLGLRDENTAVRGAARLLSRAFG